MFYLLTSVLLICLHILLTFTSPINIFPELFVYPWLIFKGLVPYKDFFDHHGPLLYYLLAPFSAKKDLSLLLGVFHMFQMGNLVLMLYILKKQTSRLFYVICGVLYILLSYYFTDNNFWFEHTFVFLSLCIYILTYLLRQNIYTEIGVGVGLFLVFLIKPTFILILIPVILFKRKWSILRYLCVFLSIFFSFLYITGLLSIYFDIMFAFNLKAISYIRTFYLFGIDRVMFHSILGVTFLSLIILIRQRVYYSFFVFLGIQFIFVLQGYTKINFIPFIPFFIILIGLVGKKIHKGYLLIYLFLIALFALISYQKIKHFYVISKQNIPYIKNPLIHTCLQLITNKNLIRNRQVYYDSPEFYYLLDYKPPFYYLLYLDFITTYRDDFESRTILEITKNNTQYLVLKNENKPKYKHLYSLRKFIREHFIIKTADSCFTYYQKK